MKYKILSIFAIVFIFTCCNRYIDHFKIEGYWRIIKADDSFKGTVICISKKKAQVQHRTAIPSAGVA